MGDFAALAFGGPCVLSNACHPRLPLLFAHVSSITLYFNVDGMLTLDVGAQSRA